MTTFFSENVSYTVDADDPFEWTGAFHIAMTESTVDVTVNIKLVGAEPGAALRNAWTNVAETYWNDKAFFSDGTWLYKITFDFNLVTSGQHHTVTVHAGSGRANMTNWYTIPLGGPTQSDEVAAHEIGHMMGCPDEYAGGGTFNNYTTTGTLMSDLTVMSNTTTAGYENYFGDIEYYVQEFGYGDPNNDAVELVLAKLGTAGNDVLTGTNGMDPILGLGGNDILRGLNGNDHLEGGAGNDTLIGGMGYNVMDGGPGTDTVDYRFYNGPIEVDLAGGNASFVGDPDPEYLSTIENVLAGNGNDDLYGNNAANLLNGGGGNDWLQGAKGNDIYHVNTSGDIIIELAGGGVDTVIASASYRLTQGTPVAQVERLQTINAAATTTINLTGNSFGQLITGNAGVNTISGLAGNDIISGRGGKDVLAGGAGFNSFLFNTAPSSSNLDRITDFNVAADEIQVENAIFTGVGAAGIISADAFHVGATAADAEDRIVYNKLTGALLYDSNGTGGGGFVQFALLPKNLALTRADIEIV